MTSSAPGFIVFLYILLVSETARGCVVSTSVLRVSVLGQPAASHDARRRTALRQRHTLSHDVTVVARTAAHRPHAVTPAHAA